VKTHKLLLSQLSWRLLCIKYMGNKWVTTYAHYTRVIYCHVVICPPLRQRLHMGIIIIIVIGCYNNICISRIAASTVRFRDWKVCNARSSSYWRTAVEKLMAFRYNLTKFVRVPENPSAAPFQTPKIVIKSSTEALFTIFLIRS